MGSAISRSATSTVSEDGSAPARGATGVPAIALWGILGVLAILGQAIWRLTPIALQPYREGGLSWWMWALALVWIVSQRPGGEHGAAGAEAQQGDAGPRAAPRVVSRAWSLKERCSWLQFFLAPLFCMGFFHATRKRLIVSWCVIAGIFGLVLLVHQLAQPWRGIVDTGVVLGLVYGAFAVVWFFARAAAGHLPPIPPEVPESWKQSAG